MTGDAGAQQDSLEDITDALLIASRLLVGISARSIEAVDSSLTIPQFRALATLSHQGTVNLATLAGLLEVKPSAAGRMVDRLVNAGLIVRHPHPSSRRELLVELSPRGREVLQEVMNRRRGEVSGIVEKMAASDRRGLARTLSAFTKAGGEPSVVFDGT